MRRRELAGFTLMELLVVMAIFAILAGIAYASSGGVREKARQAVCTSNLRQLGQAIAMYRQDYNGLDMPAKYWQMGFPGDLFTLVDEFRPGGKRYVTGHDELLHCPSKIPRPTEVQERAIAGRWVDYGYGVWDSTEGTPLPPFEQAIAQRGTDYPIIECWSHDIHVRPQDRPSPNRFYLILRLDGRVSAGLKHRSLDGWEL